MAEENCLVSKPKHATDPESRPSRFTFDLDAPSSPEMFDSDPEPEPEPEPAPSPVKLTRDQLIAKSDQRQHSKISKYLSGIPPPPKHSSCPLDCEQMLALITQNKDYFWTKVAGQETCTDLDTNEHSNDSAYPDNESLSNEPLVDNLAVALETNEQSKDSGIVVANNSGSSDTFTMSSTSLNSSKSKEFTEGSLDERTLLLYNSMDPSDVLDMSFNEAFQHKAFGLHYNRNKYVEEFERLSVRLCERYIHVDTASTCNVWFTNYAASSLKSHTIAEKPKSPGKRLSYLAKRRRTFSRANLQNLTAMDKKHRFVTYKKAVMKKGKSPRGKSPRGKSPRVKTPRSSAKKRAIRRLALDGQSPLKSKAPFPKRALFQSPPSEKPGPSHTLSHANPHTIKRALFSTSEDDAPICSTESRKRKCDEPLEGARHKWARSLSYDCPRTSPKAIERLASEANLANKSVFDSGKMEMSSAHRKKLLWAVAEALRGKGIGMGDPRFKQYATCLARTVKKYMPDLENRHVPRKPGSTTDRMLKLAKQQVYLVMEGKLVA